MRRRWGSDVVMSGGTLRVGHFADCDSHAAILREKHVYSDASELESQAASHWDQWPFSR